MLKKYLYTDLLISYSLSCYANKIPTQGAGIGFQLPLKNSHLEATVLRTPKRAETDREESYTLYKTDLFEGLMKRYWPISIGSHAYSPKHHRLYICLGGGGWLSLHRELYNQNYRHIYQPPHSISHPIIRLKEVTL